MTEKVDYLKNLRLQIYMCINTIVLLPQSAEITLAKRELQRSSMWLGKVMEEYGSVSPYNAKGDLIPQAEHTTDVISTNELGESFQSLTDIDKLQCMRLVCEDIVKMIKKQWNANEFPTSDSCQYFLEARMRLMEAKMWFGTELNNIFQKYKQAEGVAAN